MCFDRLLLKKAQQGDIAAVEKLLAKYERYVYNVALGFFKDSFDAADAAQEAMIKIYKKLNSFRGDSSFKSWIFRLTINTCKDELKRKKNIITFQNEILDSKPSQDFTPEEALLEKNHRAEIITAINQLDEDHRHVIILRDINDQTYDQIARTLEISIGTVKSRISRARGKLKEILI
jgi:RNA polymerase sigma-70 factor, ECF subfamily